MTRFDPHLPKPSHRPPHQESPSCLSHHPAVDEVVQFVARYRAIAKPYRPQTGAHSVTTYDEDWLRDFKQKLATVPAEFRWRAIGEAVVAALPRSGSISENHSELLLTILGARSPRRLPAEVAQAIAPRCMNAIEATVRVGRYRAIAPLVEILPDHEFQPSWLVSPILVLANSFRGFDKDYLAEHVRRMGTPEVVTLALRHDDVRNCYTNEITMLVGEKDPAQDIRKVARAFRMAEVLSMPVFLDRVEAEIERHLTSDPPNLARAAERVPLLAWHERGQSAVPARTKQFLDRMSTVAEEAVSQWVARPPERIYPNDLRSLAVITELFCSVRFRGDPSFADRLADIVVETRDPPDLTELVVVAARCLLPADQASFYGHPVVVDALGEALGREKVHYERALGDSSSYKLFSRVAAFFDISGNYMGAEAMNAWRHTFARSFDKHVRETIAHDERIKVLVREKDLDLVGDELDKRLLEVLRCTGITREGARQRSNHDKTVAEILGAAPSPWELRGVADLLRDSYALCCYRETPAHVLFRVAALADMLADERADSTDSIATVTAEEAEFHEVEGKRNVLNHLDLFEQAHDAFLGMKAVAERIPNGGIEERTRVVEEQIRLLTDHVASERGTPDDRAELAELRLRVAELRRAREPSWSRTSVRPEFATAADDLMLLAREAGSGRDAVKYYEKAQRALLSILDSARDGNRARRETTKLRYDVREPDIDGLELQAGLAELRAKMRLALVFERLDRKHHRISFERQTDIAVREMLLRLREAVRHGRGSGSEILRTTVETMGKQAFEHCDHGCQESGRGIVRLALRARAAAFRDESGMKKKTVTRFGTLTYLRAVDMRVARERTGDEATAGSAETIDVHADDLDFEEAIGRVDQAYRRFKKALRKSSKQKFPEEVPDEFLRMVEEQVIACRRL